MNVHLLLHERSFSPLLTASRKVTITEVARAAKVSIQTVSAVVNQKPGISEPTRQRVWRVVEQLHYRPNGIASSLRAQRSHTLGVLIPTITNPFFPEFVRGAGDAASKKGYSIFLCNSDEDSEKEIQYLRLLQRHRVAGVLVASVTGPVAAESVLQEFVLNRTPVAYLGASRPRPGIVVLRVNESEITRVAVKHLLELGHRRIAFITPPPAKSICQARIDGFKKGLGEVNLPIREEYFVAGGFEFKDGIRGAEQLVSLRYPPTAIVAANDLVAIGAISTLKKYGWCTPGDMSVVGIDDIPMASLLDPPLTSVTQPIYEMGRQGIENILLRIQDPQLGAAEVLFETRLTIRESTAPRPNTKSWRGRSPQNEHSKSEDRLRSNSAAIPASVR
jgi:LacI family transcriptional regulator